MGATEDRRRQKTAERQETDGRRPQNGRRRQHGCPGPFLGSGHYFNFGCEAAKTPARRPEMGTADGHHKHSRRACGECTCASVMHTCKCGMYDCMIRMHAWNVW